MNTNKEIGKRIRKRRLEIGMTQQELTEKMGFKSRSSINKIEIGGRRINPERIKEFAKVLDTTPSYLLGLDDNDFVFVNIKLNEKERKRFNERIAINFGKLNEENKKELEKFCENLLRKQNQK